MELIKVKNLCKEYHSFSLDNVSFTLSEGEIMGFIGRNGAGKSTTLKCMLDMVHPLSGKIEFFGKNFVGNEEEIKPKIGFVAGGIDYYLIKKIKSITDATKRFYSEWDENAYRSYLKVFSIDENKTPKELSQGMRVKYSLALALSHKARVLILDEPTSGLDPVSRDELLDIFLGLKRKGIAILFSTHITSDLDKCADTITYIKNGGIVACEKIEDFIGKYCVVSCADVSLLDHSLTIGLKPNKSGYTALIEKKNADCFRGVEIRAADLEDIMIFFEKNDAESLEAVL